MGGKPRPTLAATELRIAYGGSGRSQRAAIDLRTGRCVASVTTRGPRDGWQTRDVEVIFANRDLDLLVETARAILREGDVVHHDQFAQEGVAFTSTSSGRTATADYHVDVGVSTKYDDAYSLVFRRVNRELD